MAHSSNRHGHDADSDLNGQVSSLWLCPAAIAAVGCSFVTEGDVRVFRLVALFWKVVSAAKYLYLPRPGCSNASVAVSLFAPPGAAVGVIMGGCFSAAYGTSPASTVSLVLSAWVVKLSSMLLRLLSINLLLVLDA